MTFAEVDYFLAALYEVTANYAEWKKDYIYDPKKNEFEHRLRAGIKPAWLDSWFEL
jgi:hypothetical protein